MLVKIRCVFLFVLGIIFCSGLFANDISGVYFDGDLLNSRISTYVKNVSLLTPDSATLQNIWSYVPKGRSGFIGIGVNGSVTFLDQRLASRALDDAYSFGGKHNDLSNFPETIPFLPGISFDIRGGYNRLDVGVYGMWLDENILAEEVGATFLGSSNAHFNYRSLGFDIRYVLFTEKEKTPAITVQGGYIFTWMGFGISSGDSEKVHTDFRNDSFFVSVQATKGLPFIFTPYIGFKAIFSKTDSAYSWETKRPVMINGNSYLEGARYESGANEGDFYTYLQVYGGLGISFLFDHLMTLGVAYNVMSNHFCFNLAVRLIL